jgi:hypothetical protein
LQIDEIEVKAFLLWNIKDPYEEKLPEAIRNRVASSSLSACKASSGIIHLLKEMYDYVMELKTVEVPEELFNVTCNRRLMLGTGETSRRNERVHALHENYAEYRFNVILFRGDSVVYEYGAIKYLANPNNHMNMNPERFMIPSIFALYPGGSRKARCAIIHGSNNDRQHEGENGFVDEKTSHTGERMKLL